MAAEQLEGDDAAERQPGHMGPREAERRHEPGQALGIVGDPEAGRRIRGAAGAGCVPSDDRELVGQTVQLGSPGGYTVGHEAVEQHQRWTAPRPLVADAQPVHVHVVHHRTPSRVLGWSK